VEAGEAQQSDSARCGIGCTAALVVEWSGMAKAHGNSLEKWEKARDGTFAYMEVEEKEIDKKAGNACCTADLGMP